jgi:hypothetical protein
MKKVFLCLSVLSLTISCSKDSDDVTPVLETGYPHQWIFTRDVPDPFDPAVPEYTYIYTNLYAMFRDDIQKSYPIKDLADEEHCLFYVSETSSSTAKKCYTIQLDSDRIRFLGVGPSTNKEETHLYIAKGAEVVVVGNPSYFAPPDDDNEEGDYWKFYIHKMPDEDGVTTVAIESVGMPGWYISDSPPGFNYAANVVTLETAVSAGAAPKWQCRSIK